MKLTLKDKKVLVLGLGDTGLSALHWLKSQGAILSVADSRETPPDIESVIKRLPEVIVHTGAFKVDTLLAAELIVISPGVSIQEPAVQTAISNGIQVIGDVELFAQYRPQHSKVIAITGSNGKTTVTTLVGEICKAAGLKTIVAGNIGLPVLEALMMETPDVYVLELSSFQLETMHSLIVDAATVLNICEDHMDRYANMQDYIAAKTRIFDHAKVAVLNRDDDLSMAIPANNIVTFGLNVAPKHQSLNHVNFGLIDNENEQYLACGSEPLIESKELKIKGQHNIANALAAAALCNAIGIKNSAIAVGLLNFKGLPHRVEWVANFDDIDFYDDSKGTNVGAACAAIVGMTKNNVLQKVVLIAGGDGKNQDFSPLLSAVDLNARAIVLIGRDADLIESALLSTNVPMYRALDLAEAVAIAHKVAKSGDAVLLSPACASFDMFKNYVHRAEVFIEAVKNLEKQCTHQNSPKAQSC